MNSEPRIGAAANISASAAGHVAEECGRLRAQVEDLARREVELRRQLEEARRHLFVPPGHYYSPIVNVDEVRDPFVRGQASLPVDIEMSLEAHVARWSIFESLFDALPCLQQAPYRYNEKNDDSSYPLADALVLQAMIATLQPKTYIEVGSGFSSLAMLDAVDVFCETRPATTLIEPFPDLVRSLLRPGDLERLQLIESPVQDVPLDVFARLEPNDILFIDSTHVLKTGSDVHFELFEVLPRLNAGVYVHFHDIFWPFEYLRPWIFEAKRSWNELYALRAFLAHNKSWEVAFFSDYFVQCAPEQSRRNLPVFFSYRPGSLWLRKR